MVDAAGGVPLATPIADLVDADRDEPVEAVLVEVIGDDALNDLPDGVPADPQQPGDRGLGHLLRQPRHDVLKVAGMRAAGPGPRHGLGAHPASRATQPAQLTLDHAAVCAQVQVAPALDAPVMDLQMTAGLPAA